MNNSAFIEDYGHFENSTDDEKGHGGAIYIQNYSFEITNSSFLENKADIGGALYLDFSHTKDTAVAGNVAKYNNATKEPWYFVTDEGHSYDDNDVEDNYEGQTVRDNSIYPDKIALLLPKNQLSFTVVKKSGNISEDMAGVASMD